MLTKKPPVITTVPKKPASLVPGTALIRKTELIPYALVTVASPAQAIGKSIEKSSLVRLAAPRPIQRRHTIGIFTWFPLSVSPVRRLLFLIIAIGLFD